MVVQPLGVPSSSEHDILPAWRAIEARQRDRAHSYLLITQPDHARLSGELAARFASPDFPQLSRDAVAAIGAHDEGWGIFPGEAAFSEQPLDCDGKPRSFIEFGPEDFTRAWIGSIDHAESLSLTAGILVSRHFYALGESALAKFDEQQSTVVRAFLDAERARQQRLGDRCACDAREIEDGLKALQFCDLLSLVLCSGVKQQIEFPQQFGASKVRMRIVDGVYELTPSPFQTDSLIRREVAVHVTARPYPGTGSRPLSFVLR